MARKRVVTEPVLKDWQAVDDALRDIRECQHALTELAVEQARRIDREKDECKCKAAPLNNRIKRLEAEIKEFVDSHRAELTGKSRCLTFGTVGYHLSSKLVTNLKDEDTIALLEAMGRTEFIRITKHLDKEALKKQLCGLLDKIDAWVKIADNFSYDTTDPQPEA